MPTLLKKALYLKESGFKILFYDVVVYLQITFGTGVYVGVYLSQNYEVIIVNILFVCSYKKRITGDSLTRYLLHHCIAYLIDRFVYISEVMVFDLLPLDVSINSVLHCHSGHMDNIPGYNIF